MTQILARERVRLQIDLPELELKNGAVGEVISTWFHPNTAYEVEFSIAGDWVTRRVLLLHHQIAPER